MKLSEAIYKLQYTLALHGDKELKQWRHNDGQVRSVPVKLEVAENPEGDTIGIILSCTE